MSGLLIIFGAIHVVAYTIAGFIFASRIFVDWAVRRFKLKADMTRAFLRMLDERRAAKEKATHQ